ncbi:unnamed protein product [Adineta ricciae]|uniref:Uncharacterized protein n=1 Tax=Adineta ricciae TaxID=249248 RepID=A0A814YPR9_ADIRI|nr:unnamed protein product [Adineta ricciae]
MFLFLSENDDNSNATIALTTIDYISNGKLIVTDLPQVAKQAQIADVYIHFFGFNQNLYISSSTEIDNVTQGDAEDLFTVGFELTSTYLLNQIVLTDRKPLRVFSSPSISTTQTAYSTDATPTTTSTATSITTLGPSGCMITYTTVTTCGRF